MINLQTTIDQISKIGPAYQKRLKKLGIKIIYDLFFHFPSRYDDFSDIIKISQARQKLGEIVCIEGKILEIGNTNVFKRSMVLTEAIVEDDSSYIKIIWFNQPYLTKNLATDDFVCLAGKVSLGKEGLFLNNPVYERINEKTEKYNLTHTGRIIPVYPETRGLSSRWLRFVIKPLLFNLAGEMQEILPLEIIKKHKFIGIKQAIWQVHFPDSLEAADAAKARFSFEELFLIQLSVLKEKAKLMQKTAFSCPMDASLMKLFTESLPFQLTDSQKKCSFQILKDLEKSVPMSRLLEGDVGSGKTVVATMAALNTARCNYQVAFMAPTEILAKQHFKEISGLLKNFNIKIGLLTGKDARIMDVRQNKKKLIYELPKKKI